MKRMVLIPEERLLRYKERDKQRIENTYNDSPEGIMYGGGEDYEEILENSKCDRQRAINTYYDPPVGIYYKPPKGIMYGGGEDTLSSEMIIRAIPKTMKTRAQALLEHLKEREDVITWDDVGQVLLNGILIPKSNISDLISDAMRARKYFNPVGVREFYNVLNEINIPKDLVRNERRWSEVEKDEIKSTKVRKVPFDEKTFPARPRGELEVQEWITF